MGYTAKPPGGPRGWERALPIVLGVLGIAVGLLIGFVAFDSGDDDGGSSGNNGGGNQAASASFATGTEPIELPDRLGAFQDTVAAQKAKTNGGASPAVDERQKNVDEVGRRTTAAYSAAYGGAGTGYREYSDEDLLHNARVIAVRARAPGLTIGPVIDPSYLKIGAPQDEVKKVGETECHVFNGFVKEGDQPNPDELSTVNCQRTGDKITVFVFGNGFTGPDGMPLMAKLADDAYTAAAGG